MLGILQQGWVLRAAHDVLINLTGLVALQQFRLHHLAVDIHTEVRQHSSLRHGENEMALEPDGIGVVENLLHRGLGNLVGDFDIHLLLLHLHRRKVVNTRARHRPRSGRPDRVNRWLNDRPRMGQNAHIVTDNQPACMGLKRRGQGHKGQQGSE